MDKRKCADNDSSQARGIPEDRLSQARREGTMGYEEVVSPTTGERFEMPLETYDPTVGGYRNPNQPREILSPGAGPAGEGSPPSPLRASAGKPCRPVVSEAQGWYPARATPPAG